MPHTHTHTRTHTCARACTHTHHGVVWSTCTPQAKLNFYTDHVPLIGPTIYVVDDAQFVVEDISAAMFRDFLYCKRCGQSHVTRVRGFGYGAMIAVEWNNDVISFTEVHYHVNTSPYIVGHGWGTPNFTWAPAIIAGQDGTPTLTFGPTSM